MVEGGDLKGQWYTTTNCKHVVNECIYAHYNTLVSLHKMWKN